MQIRTRAAFRAAFPVVRTVTTPDSMNETLVAGADVLPASALAEWLGVFPDATDRKLWKRLKVRRLTPVPSR
jgi:hypothetical protein